MFSKRKNPSPIKMTQLSSLIAEGVEITGDVVFSGGMRVDGRVNGNVIGRSLDGKAPALLVLSDKGRIEGSVRCPRSGPCRRGPAARAPCRPGCVR